MKFGDNLRKFRKNKKMSQEKLAEKMNVSRQSVSKWELSESYPEMSNILKLCDIFHCTINDLVNDTLIDIDSLDEDIKMSVVKFKKEKQKKMKGISKTIYVTSRVMKIMLIIAIMAVFILMIFAPILLNNVEIDENNIKIFDQNYEYKIDSKSKIISLKDEKDRTQTFRIDTSSNLQEYLTSHSKIYYILSTEFVAGSMVFFVIISIFILNYIEKLFVNIYNESTPFTLENVKYIRKISLFLIIVIILPNILGILFQLVTNLDMNIEFELMDLIFILIIFSLSYIFEYGYEIQLDSKGRMYGDEE